MAAAAPGQLAAAAARHGAAARALHALLGAVPDGASRAAARLLLCELAAALGVELLRQPHQGGGGQPGLAKTRRRREQRRAALARLCSRSAAHGDGVISGCGRGGKDKVTGAGVGGTWFQSSSSSVAGATATRGDRSSIATGAARRCSRSAAHGDGVVSGCGRGGKRQDDGRRRRGGMVSIFVFFGGRRDGDARRSQFDRDGRRSGRRRGGWPGGDDGDGRQCGNSCYREAARA